MIIHVTKEDRVLPISVSPAKGTAMGLRIAGLFATFMFMSHEAGGNDDSIWNEGKEQRFHELQHKKSQGTLTQQEKNELNDLYQHWLWYTKGGREGEVARTGNNAFKIAQSGGKHSGFLKNYLGRSPDQINKAINTLQTGKRGINVHLDKISNPSKYVPNWNTLRSGHQQSLIRGWQKEITNGREQIEILRGILGN